MNESASFAGRPGGDEPRFAEPWQARVFAIAVTLHERGLYTWPEWADALAARITAAQAVGDPDLGDTYYHHWLGALDDLLTAKDIGSAAETARWRDAWQHAAHRTPHGRPIELKPNDFDTSHNTNPTQ
jgi:nitrile hydratase accessory protein